MQRGLVVQPDFRSAAREAVYLTQQARRQPTQTNQQGLGLIFNPSLVGQPGSEHTQKEKLSRKQEMKQQREQEENSRPKLPVNQAEHRNGDEQVRKRRARRDAGWKIKSALTAANRDALVAKYRSGASETSDREWIISVAHAVANGLRPYLTLPLTATRHKDFRERCAYCGRAGCVEISEPNTKGKSHVRCTHDDCPLNWVNFEHRRQVSPSTPSVAAYKYEVKRWAMLPALIEEIKNLVDRTEYDNYGNAVRLHDSAEVAQQANNARQQANNARRQAATRVQTIEKLQSGEKLSDDEKRDLAKKALAKKAAKAGLVKCRTTRAPGSKGCGSTNVRLNVPRKNSMQFKCKDCGKTFSYKIDELLAILPAAAPGAEQNEPQMQRLRANYTFNMNQMNNNNNINNLNDLNNINNINNNSLNRYVDCEFYDSEDNLIELYEEGRPTVKERGNGPQQSMQNMNQMNGLLQNNHFDQNQRQTLRQNTNQMNNNNNINNLNNANNINNINNLNNLNNMNNNRFNHDVCHNAEMNSDEIMSAATFMAETEPFVSSKKTNNPR